MSTHWLSGGSTSFAVVSPSGDTTGATDVATLQAALTAATVPYGSMPPAGPTAAGNVVIMKPGVWTTNAPLKIGSFTTLDARGSVINLASGTNNNMLQNYGATAVMTTTGGAGASANVISFVLGAADPVLQQLLLINPTLNTGLSSWGVTLTIPNAFSSNGFTNPAYNGSTGAVCAGNFQHVNSFNQAVLDTTTPSNASSQTVSLYYRDTQISILGGVWNHGTNGTGSTSYLDHCFRFMFMDGLTISGATLLSQGSNGLYGVDLIGVTTSAIGPLYFNVYPGDWPWQTSHASGYQRDGVHIVGPSRDIHVFGLKGSTGDDLLSITAFDWLTSSLGIGGNISNIVGENLYAGYSNAGLFKVLSSPGATVTGIRGRRVSGQGQTLAWIGDDDRNVATQGGTVDDVILEDASATGINTSAQLIVLQGVGIGRVELRKFTLTQVASSSVNLAEVGLRPGGSAYNTTVADLLLDSWNIKSITAGKKVLNVQSTATISQLRYRDWVAPLTNYPLIANAGTITNAYSNDVLPLASLTGQTAAVGPVAAFTPGIAGVYEFTVDLRMTTAGNAVNVTASIQTNNGSANFTQTTNNLAANALNEVSQTFSAYCAAGQAINYSTAVSGAIGTGVFAVSIRAVYQG